MTSWDYSIIPTVSIQFTITLTFLSPSQLKDITEYVTDTNSYNFTLEGVRSCDPFTKCITATNIVGQSPPSCVNETLPYIPTTNDIEYSLFRVGDSYSLNLTIQVFIYNIIIMIHADFIFLFKMFRCQIVHQMATFGCLLCFKVKILVFPHCHHNSFYLTQCRQL